MRTRRELLAQAERAWPRFLRSLVTGDPFFPLAVRIGKTRLAGDYAMRRAALEAFNRDAVALGLSVDWSETGHRRFQTHEIPTSAAWQNESTYLQALGRTATTQAFREDVALLPAELHSWAAEHPLDVVAHHGAWPELLRCVFWFREHPRSGLYLRQIPVDGIDTKFLEQHLGILDALLLNTMPLQINVTAKRFESRHGLCWEQPLIRFRFLDSTLQRSHGFPVADMSVPAPTFRALSLQRVNAIVTENLRNFLSLPPLPNSVAVVGGGDAAALLSDTPWLGQSRILYWGDLDARGFAILSRLRAVYPKVESVMMDLATLELHKNVAVKVDSYQSEVPMLTPEENASLKRLGSAGLWLEQERVPFSNVVEVFERVTSSVATPAPTKSPPDFSGGDF